MGHHPFKKLRNKMTPKQRAQADAQAKQTKAEMLLARLRKQTVSPVIPRQPHENKKQRRSELTAKRQARRKKKTAEKDARQAARRRAQWEREAARGAVVNADALSLDGSYDDPEFVKRGYYLDIPFMCHDCRKEEIWTATQQKWWYEIAKGSRWTIARRCRTCRRRERDRRNEARRVHLEGIARKRK